MTHFEHLCALIPSLRTARILDVGSGKGGFIIDAATHGAHVCGVEYNPAYITETQKRAAAAGVVVTVVQGAGETLPYADHSFDFVNMSEVFEHVHDPALVMREVRRVLVLGGAAYVSVPNRFGFVDQHFHLPFVNWLPRAWADAFITRFGVHKNYADTSAGRQRLSDMHYRTFSRVAHELRILGFEVADARELRLKDAFGYLYPLVWLAYAPLRFCIFDSFHLIVRTV